MARGGMRVLCLEKNHFIGGMATTTELARGYRFELAGSIQFPVPSEIYDDLGFDACPIYEPEVQSAALGPAGEAAAAALQRSGQAVRAPERAHGPGGRPGHGRDRRAGPTPRPGPSGASTSGAGPGSLDEMFACATDETERQAIRTAMFGSVMDVVDRHLPDRRRACPGTQHAAPSSRSTPPTGARTPRAVPCAWPSPWPPPPTPRCPRSRGASAPCPTTWPTCSPSTVVSSAVTSRWPAIATESGRVTGRHPGRRRDRLARRWSCPTSIRPPPSPSCSTRRRCPTTSPAASAPSTTGRLYFQMHFALDGLPEYAGPYEELERRPTSATT